MNTSCRELKISNVLSDPLVRAVMAADGIDPGQFAAMLGDIARKLETHNGQQAKR